MKKLNKNKVRLLFESKHIYFKTMADKNIAYYLYINFIFKINLPFLILLLIILNKYLLSESKYY